MNVNNENTTGRAKIFNWLDSIMGSVQSSKPSKDVGGLDTPPQQNMSSYTSGINRSVMSNLGQTAPRQPSVDWGFIQQLEGRKLKGYVPQDKAGNVLGQSGVTVGTGFDIGQRSVADLRKMGLPTEIVDKLTPYAGKKKQAAVNAINKQPLRLTDKEVDLIDQVVKKQALDNLISSYNKKSKTKFEDLLPEQQTILASVAFQYGDLAKRTPNFWKQVTEGNWQQAHRNLMNFGDKYQTRRHQEARLLSRILSA